MVPIAITRRAIFHESVSLELAKVKAIINSGNKREFCCLSFFMKSKHSSNASFCDFSFFSFTFQ